MLVALAAVAGALLAPRPLLAAVTCDSQVDKAATKFASAVAKKAAGACKKSPGGTCFNVAVKAVQGKALKKCDAAAVAAKFGGSCPSRDTSCAPATITTADQAAACLSCSIQSDVRCLAATAFAGGSVPSYCGN
jgi:hypothetical protein